MSTPVYNASAKVTDTDGDATATIASFSAAAGSDRFLEVWIEVGAGSMAAHSGVTWGGVSLTQRGTTLTVGANGRMSKWFLKEANFPSGATGDVVATLASGQDEVQLFAMIHDTVDQTNPYRGASQSTNTGTFSNAASVVVSSDAADVVTHAVWGVDTGGHNTGISVTTGTSRQEVDNLGSFGAESGGIGNLAGSGSVTPAWTFAQSGGLMETWGMLGDSLQGSSGGGGPTGNPWYYYAQQ